jgi:hypothetical protein
VFQVVGLGLAATEFAESARWVLRSLARVDRLGPGQYRASEPTLGINDPSLGICVPRSR